MENRKFNPLGYSQKMFERIKRKKVLFALSIVIIVLCTPFLYISLTDEYVLIPSYVAYIIAGIMALFAVIMILNAGKNHESTFQGEIFNKEIAQVTHKSGKVTYNSRIWVKDINGYHAFYDLFVNSKKNKAGIKKQFDYYKVGDTVRKVYGLRFPEKLDKSNDKMIICLKCGHLNSHELKKCSACRFIIFK